MPFTLFACVVLLLGAAGCTSEPAATSPSLDPLRADGGPLDGSTCTHTACGDECVDTGQSDDHCGACGTACTPAAACLMSTCQCPGDFVPRESNTVFSAVMATPDAGFLGVGAFLDGRLIHFVSVGFTEGVALDTPIDLATTGPGSSTTVGAGYDYDMTTMIGEGSFAAVSGTVTFTSACAGGVAGTVSNARFVEVRGLQDRTPISGGCTFELARHTFAYGEPCVPGGDSGVGTSGMPAASP